MFKNTKAFSGFSVKDSDEALNFYQDVLGLDVTQDNSMGGILTLQLAGDYKVIAYPKQNHEPATFTILNFQVSDVTETVKQLKTKGVTFESYDMPGFKTDEDDVFRGGGPIIAWFKDPSGNILSVIEQ